MTKSSRYQIRLTPQMEAILDKETERLGVDRSDLFRMTLLLWDRIGKELKQYLIIPQRGDKE